jgi:pimeloyl-ACP methyl ester carboxylesterase|nr:alpha/beta hydrolase [Neorhizobium tomejilense]
MLPQVSEFKSRHGLLRFRDSGGRCEPLILLHGSSYSSNVFSHLFSSELGRSFRLIAIDLPGHGLSTDAFNPLKTYSVGGFADCVVDLAAHLVLPSFSLFGWSLGGHVAMEVAARGHPVRGLILSGAPPVSQGMLGMLSGFKLSVGLAIASKRIFSTRDAAMFESMCIAPGSRLYETDLMRADGRVRQLFAKSLLRADYHDQRSFVESTSIPVCILNGELDPFVRASHAQRIKRRSPKVLNVSVKGVGHAVFHQDPGVFVRIVSDFLSPGSARQLDRPIGLSS